MSVLNRFEGKINEASNKIANPFQRTLQKTIDKEDFPDGFKITELLPNGKVGAEVSLIGNWMPKIPFTFGGSVRFKKEFYSGYSEPTMQIFGPEEDDITINGLFKDKRFQDLSLKNISTEMQQKIDSIRIRGNIVRIQLGEFDRYAIISNVSFNLSRLSNVEYSITFSVIGFNAPKNAKFLQRRKEVPFEISSQLNDLKDAFANASGQIPDSVGGSIADEINGLINEVSGAITNVTDFVDQIFTTIQDVKSAVNRAKGLIKFTQRKLNDFKRKVGSITSFDPATSITGRYSSAKYASSSVARASNLTAFLESLRRRISELIDDLPQARHLVKEGDNLQKIAIKFYGSADNWKKIYDFNSLNSTELANGTLLEIPRL